MVASIEEPVHSGARQKQAGAVIELSARTFQSWVWGRHQYRVYLEWDLRVMRGSRISIAAHSDICEIQ